MTESVTDNLFGMRVNQEKLFFFNLMSYNIKTKSYTEFHKKLVILQLSLPSLLKRINATRK